MSGDVSQRVREADVTDAASKVSVHPRVREWMVARQREMGAGGGVVMEGRDIGRKSFRTPTLGFFLMRIPTCGKSGGYCSSKLVVRWRTSTRLNCGTRDQRDGRGEFAARAASDAVILDSTDLGEDEVLARIERCIQES